MCVYLSIYLSRGGGRTDYRFEESTRLARDQAGSRCLKLPQHSFSLRIVQGILT